MLSVNRVIVLGSALSFMYCGLGHADEFAPPSREPSKWQFSLATALSQADIRVIDSDAQVPENTVVEDLEIETSDELDISATSLTAAVSYRILPILQVTGRAGFVASEVKTEFDVSGNLDGPLAVFSGPFEFTADGSREVDGYTVGFGVTGGLPIATVRSRGLAVFAGYSANYSTLDDGEVNSTATRTSIGLAYPADKDSHTGITYTVGASYNWLQREVEQSASFGGTEIGLVIEQEYVEPWNLDAGFIIPVRKNIALGVGVSHSMSGATSALLNLSFDPKKR